MSFELQFEELESAKRFKKPKAHKIRKRKPKIRHIQQIEIKQYGLRTGVIILVNRRSAC